MSMQWAGSRWQKVAIAFAILGAIAGAVNAGRYGASTTNLVVSVLWGAVVWFGIVALVYLIVKFVRRVVGK